MVNKELDKATALDTKAEEWEPTWEQAQDWKPLKARVAGGARIRGIRWKSYRLMVTFCKRRHRKDRTKRGWPPWKGRHRRKRVAERRLKEFEEIHENLRNANMWQTLDIKQEQTKSPEEEGYKEEEGRQEKGEEEKKEPHGKRYSGTS